MNPVPAPLRAATLLLLGMTLQHTAGADWRDLLQRVPGLGQGSAESVLSDSEVIRGLKAALGQGVERAVSSLGSEGGFLSSERFRIPLPETLRPLARGLRGMGQGGLVDDLETAMNRAAEAAVPEAGAILNDAITQMTLEDARQILDGPDDAATRYFQRVSEDRLSERMLPVVAEHTDQVGVASYYKQLVGKAGFLSGLVDTSSLDLDRYVTDQALDGLFTVIAEEEARIRANPAARTTELLEKVFSSVGD
jgi:hypothetical protein